MPIEISNEGVTGELEKIKVLGRQGLLEVESSIRRFAFQLGVDVSV